MEGGGWEEVRACGGQRADDAPAEPATAGDSKSIVSSPGAGVQWQMKHYTNILYPISRFGLQSC